MEMIEEIRSDVAVLTVSGSLMSCQDVGALHTHIKQLGKRGFRRVVIDYSEVRWFGSAMLGVLVSSKMTLCNGGGDLRLAGLSEKCRSVIRVAHLDRVFQVMDTVDAAVASFEDQPLELKAQINGAVTSFKARLLQFPCA